MELFGKDREDKDTRSAVPPATSDTSPCEPRMAAKNARTDAAGRFPCAITTSQADPAVSLILQTLDWEEARTFQNPAGYGKDWLVTHKHMPQTRDLGVPNEIALLVLVKTDSSLEVAGLTRGSETTNLKVGWNFLNSPSYNPRDISSTLVGTPNQTAEGFDPTEKPRKPRRFVESDLLGPFAGSRSLMDQDPVRVLAN